MVVTSCEHWYVLRLPHQSRIDLTVHLEVRQSQRILFQLGFVFCLVHVCLFDSRILIVDSRLIFE